MNNELLERAISLCRSAKSISLRGGQQTNWEAFEKALAGVLDDYRYAVSDHTRARFQNFIKQSPHFSCDDCEGLVRDGFGYADLEVQGAWVAYIEGLTTPSPAPTNAVSGFTTRAVLPGPPMASDVEVADGGAYFGEPSTEKEAE